MSLGVAQAHSVLVRRFLSLELGTGGKEKGPQGEGPGLERWKVAVGGGGEAGGDIPQSSEYHGPEEWLKDEGPPRALRAS